MSTVFGLDHSVVTPLIRAVTPARESPDLESSATIEEIEEPQGDSPPESEA